MNTHSAVNTVTNMIREVGLCVERGGDMENVTAQVRQSARYLHCVIIQEEKKGEVEGLGESSTSTSGLDPRADDTVNDVPPPTPLLLPMDLLSDYFHHAPPAQTNVTVEPRPQPAHSEWVLDFPEMGEVGGKPFSDRIQENTQGMEPSRETHCSLS